MEAWGNSRGKAYYEAEVPPDYPKPRPGAGVREVQRWIRDKYEKRMFLPRDGSMPPAGGGGAAQAQAPVRRRTSAKPAPQPAPVAAPAPAPAPVAAPAPAPVAAPDLLSFDAFAAPAPAPAAPAEAAVAPAVAAAPGFSNFQTAPQQQPPQPQQ